MAVVSGLAQRSLASYLKLVLQPYHIWLPLVGSLALSLSIAILSLFLAAHSDRQMLESIPNQVLELLTQESPTELSSLLRTLSELAHSKSNPGARLKRLSVGF